MKTPDLVTPKQHVLTIGLEDYFHVGAFHRLIHYGKWYRFETRLERSTLRVLELLDEFAIHATFFVLGWIADTVPEIVREVARRGHEIANRGYYHRGIRELTRAAFRDDLQRSREALQRASGSNILGYRVGHGWVAPSDFWLFDVLVEEGYVYDSSLMPIYPSLRSEPWRRFVHRHICGDKELWVFPLSTWSCLGWLIPIAGGNYFRQFPHRLVQRAVAQWHRRYEAPFVMYFHVWELDDEQPKISAASVVARLRHYRNLSHMPGILRDYFQRYRFGSIANYLGLQTALVTMPATAVARPCQTARDMDGIRSDQNAASSVPQELAAPGDRNRRIPVTVVIPCFNEQPTLPYLAKTLRRMEAQPQSQYDFRFLFVDDCSTDATWDTLQSLFGNRPAYQLLQHERNRGPAAAILTGIRQAQTDIVCSIDCDCTYDPHELPRMIDLLTEDVDMVTASPYHPNGQVQNVPGWRLSLSKLASRLYRYVLHQPLHTYTSCFRVYRQRAMVDLQLKEEGYLGVTEMLGKLDLQGGRVVEYPTTLEVRLFGQSKMKVLKTILGHLRLLAQLLSERLVGSRHAGHDASHRVPGRPRTAAGAATPPRTDRNPDETNHPLSR